MSRRSPCSRLAREAGEKGGTHPAPSTPRTRSRSRRSSRAGSPFLGIAEVVEDALDAQRRRARARPRRAARGRPERARARRREAGGRMTWLVVAVGLLLLILLHELGHFAAALAVGMRPRGFYVGFPPGSRGSRATASSTGSARSRSAATCASRACTVRRRATSRPTWARRSASSRALAATVQRDAPCARGRGLRRRARRAARAASRARDRTADRAARDARRIARVRDVDDGTAATRTGASRTWKRIVVIAAGPAMNILVAFVIFFAVYATGAPSQTSRARRSASVESEHARGEGRAAGRRQDRRGRTAQPATTFDRVSTLDPREPRHADHGHRRSRRQDA